MVRLSAGTLALHFPVHSLGCAVGQPHFWFNYLSPSPVAALKHSGNKGFFNVTIVYLVCTRNKARPLVLRANHSPILTRALRVTAGRCIRGPTPAQPVYFLCGVSVRLSHGLGLSVCLSVIINGPRRQTVLWESVATMSALCASHIDDLTFSAFDQGTLLLLYNLVL